MKDALEIVGMIVLMALCLSYEGCGSTGLNLNINGKPFHFSWSIR